MLFKLILKLFTKLIIAQALVDTKTPTKAQVIHFFAFLTHSSSHPEVRYIIPDIINAITAITATYLIPEDIRFHKKSKNDFPVTQELHPGNPVQTTGGPPAKTVMT